MSSQSIAMSNLHTYSLFPYTTLFRSVLVARVGAAVEDVVPGGESQVPTRDDAAVDHGDHDRRIALRQGPRLRDRKSTRLNSSHKVISYAVFCLKKKYKVQRVLCS